MSTTPLFLRTLLDEDLPEFETEVRVRQIVDLARQTPFHAVANVGNGILLASVFWDRLSHLAIIAWLGIFTVFSVLGLYRDEMDNPQTNDRGLAELSVLT